VVGALLHLPLEVAEIAPAAGNQESGPIRTALRGHSGKNKGGLSRP
jgi:hypothetical protein